MFNKLAVQATKPIDFERMAEVWNSQFDGVDIFPKLPVYLRVHADKWDRNQRVQSTMKTLKEGIQKVEDLFTKTGQDMNLDIKSGSQSQKQDSDVWSHIRVENHAILPSGADTDESRVGRTVVTAGRQIRGLEHNQSDNDTRVFRGQDSRKRARRTCRKCVLENRQEFAKFCRGNRGETFCCGQCQTCEKCAQARDNNQE